MFGEAAMSPQLSPFRDTGLQHLLENGLRVLQQPADLPESRRAQVVDGLVQVFSEADRGGAPLRSQAALWSASDAPDFERFSVFFRYIKNGQLQDPLVELAEAKSAFESMKAGNKIDTATSGRLERLISLLLSGLRRDRVATPLVSPVEIRFS